ncbi:Gfo/Idh/MocA family oxidoreductase, partial [Candidatus Woesearchaeota archaeon]|nr:Gfo/Idh/MocA family oxidoreductase [Candidatus Woesearchaeota archaeon]
MNKKMNGLMLGAGNFANFPLQRFAGQWGKDLSDRVDKIWLADPSQDALDEKGEKYGIPPERRIKVKQGEMPANQILDQIQFAFVNTPATMHYETTAPLVANGIPVFLSKPIDADYNQALKLIELVETNGVPNVAGSQMLFHPAFMRAMQLIQEDKIDVRRVNISWVKERGPREHVIPGITTEEGPHPFSILSVLMQGLPYRVNAVDSEGEIIVNPENWKNATDKTGTRYLSEDNFKGEKYVVAGISKASMATLKYKDGRMAFVYNDFENPRKGRVIEIIGELPEGERFQRSVTMHVDITDLRDKYKEHGKHIRNGIYAWHGCLDETKKDRSGLGKLMVNEVHLSADEFGTQFEKFLDWAETGKKPVAVATF